MCLEIWTILNKIIFEKYKMRYPVTILFTVYAFIKYWAGLYAYKDKEAISLGAEQWAHIGVTPRDRYYLYLSVPAKSA